MTCTAFIEASFANNALSSNGHSFRKLRGIIVSDSFHKQLVEIDLTLACVGELNTTIRGGIHWPILYGVGEFNIK
jgi:protein N-terminal asparagine amidohydrolase